jgi:hypothetical protein
MNTRNRVLLTTLILASLTVLVGWSLLAVGYESADPLTDSQGNELGFNKPLTLELIGGLIAAALSPASLPHWSSEGWSSLCAGIQCWALVILWTSLQPKPWHRIWFATQTALFFPGFCGLLVWSVMIFSNETWDGETISDIAPIMMTAAPWLPVTWLYLWITRSAASTPIEILNLKTEATPL